jgi:glycosyltransferase involved in cell wall biosynthesis
VYSKTSNEVSISVAMCTYNGERFLRDQLESIENQTRRPYELIICDDKSSDRTIEIIEGFARNASFPVRLYRNAENLGHRKNFEQAISLCRGELIALCDQDDIWYQHKLERQAGILLDDLSIGGVFSDGDLLHAEEATPSRGLWESIRFGIRKQRRMHNGGAAKVLLQGNVVTGMTLMFRRNLRDALLPIPHGWIHDAWLAWMLTLHSTLHACPEHLVAYRVHESQQVGVPLSPIRKLRWTLANGLGAYFSQARAKSLKDYRATSAQLEDLAAHLEHQNKEANAALLKHVKNKARHVRSAASTLTQTRFTRLRRIGGQTQLYFRYSPVPLRALIRDLVI